LREPEDAPSFADVIAKVKTEPKYTRDVNSKDFLEWMASISPDLVITAYLMQIVKDDFIRTARLGCINCHAAPLPAYAGLNSGFFLLADGADCGGPTIHYITAKIDAGNILVHKPVEIRSRESVRSLAKRTAIAAACGFVEVIEMFRREVPEGIPQDIKRRGYYSKLNREVILRMYRKGHRRF
jgi:methionyl-tRNA formyltransferase